MVQFFGQLWPGILAQFFKGKMSAQKTRLAVTESQKEKEENAKNFKIMNNNDVKVFEYKKGVVKF